MKKSARRAVLGADLGATWLRLCLAENGRARWTAGVPAVDWRDLPKALPRLLRARGLKRVAVLNVGSTRLGGAAGRAILTKMLRPLAVRVSVLPDYELAH